MSNVSKRREGPRARLKSMGDHKEFLKRITKTLYYGQLPSLPCLSLPVTEISCSLWSVAQRGRSLRRLHADEAASIARGACVSPCALVLAMLYLERLKCCNPDYLAAAAPSELFLVSLMIGNKFLQDDGEDDEVICSEWAASGGLDLSQLKRLEVDFLNAIEWKVFVSGEAFETGLLWLERQVALRQAALRGFFTYGDLAAAGDAALLHELAAAAAATATAGLALALGYLASLAALLTSTLAVSHAWLPTLQYVAAARSALSPLDTTIITSNLNTELPNFNNATVDIFETVLEEPPVVADYLRCCTKWQKYQETQDEFAPQKSWYYGVVRNSWQSYEPWWSTTSIQNWLYQSSLINPMQRWLEKMGEVGEMFAKEVLSFTGDSGSGSASGPAHCGGAVRLPRSDRHCTRPWLNLSKLGALMVTVSDR